MLIFIVAVCLYTINESRAETISVSMSGDAVCGDAPPPRTCEIINLTPPGLTTADIGDTVEFDIVITNMEHIEIGANVQFGVQYVLTTTDITPESPTDLIIFDQTAALSDENGNLITDVLTIDNSFQTSGGVVLIGFTKMVPAPDFDNKILHDVHAGITSRILEGMPMGTYEIRANRVFINSDFGKVGKWPVPQIPIPTLSQWGMIVVAVVLAIAGLIVIFRRKVNA